MVDRKFAGPIQPGTDEEIFREEGRGQRLFKGPIQPGTDEETFRRTGSSGSRDIPSPPSPPPSAEQPDLPPSSAPVLTNQEQLAQQRQQDIAIGIASKTKRDTGQVVQTITRNVNESEASFMFRAEQVGKGFRQGKPEIAREFAIANQERITEEKRIEDLANTRTDQPLQAQVDLSPQSNLGVGSQFGGGVGGKFFGLSEIVSKQTFGRIPKGTILPIPLFGITGIGGGKLGIDLGKIKSVEVSPKIVSASVQTSDIFLKSVLFSPLISTGTASKQEVVGLKTLKEFNKQFEKTDIETAIIGKFETAFKTGGKAGVEKELVKLGKGITTQQEAQKFANLFKELSGRGLVGSQGGGVGVTKIKTSPPQTELTINLESFRGLPQLKNIEGILSGVSVIKDTSISPNIKDNLQSNLPTTLQLPSIISLTKGTTKQKTKLKQQSLQNLLPKLKQPQAQRQPQLQLQIQFQAQALKQNLRQQQIFRFPKIPRIKPPKTKVGFILPRIKPPKIPKQSLGSFPVFVRRGGVFRAVGRGRTPKQAFQIGKRISKQTLARSFFIGGGAKQPLQIPQFRTKAEKGRTIFIQKTGKGRASTLGSIGELREIAFFRQAKKRRRRKK